MNTYKHIYTDETNYRIWEVDENRYVDAIYYKYQEFLAGGGIPEKTSGARFVSIVDGEVVVDPQKDSILTAEDIEVKRLIKDNRLRQEISELDWKILRYIGQERLVAKGKLPKTKQSEDGKIDETFRFIPI
jgi:hypothetical protein